MEIYDAATPEEAARRARAFQKDPNLEEPVVDVYPMDGLDECTRVDLEELEQESGASDV
jgi:hypothetical protein